MLSASAGHAWSRLQRSHGHFSWRKTRQCGDRAQAGHGWPALACWSHGRRNQAMRTIPALPRLPPKATNPGALRLHCPRLPQKAKTPVSARPHCRGSPRSQWTLALFALTYSGSPRLRGEPKQTAPEGAVRFPAMQGGGSSKRLEDARRAHAGADAHGHHAVLRLVPAHAVHDGRGADRAGGAERVAERDRAAQRVDLGRVEAEVADHRQRLRGEGLVELDPVEVVLASGRPARAPRGSPRSGRCP